MDANVTSWCDDSVYHMAVSGEAASSFVVLRSMKYAANSAAKNISSLDNHTHTPIETMSGRPLGEFSLDGETSCKAPDGIAVGSLDAAFVTTWSLLP